MKLLYILVSSPRDFYYEQALLSVMSAKYRMPKVPITLLMDDATKKTLLNERKEIYDYIDEEFVVDFDSSANAMYRSRYLKTTMRNVVQDDVLYVDVDTLWVAPLDEKDFSCDVMGVPDGNVEFKDFVFYDNHMKLGEKLNFDYASVKYFFNGGVLYLKDSKIAHEFMNEWHSWWKYSCEHGVPTDQQSLNYVNFVKDGAISCLPNSYNVQTAFSVRYLLNAKLIHYFSTGLFPRGEKPYFDLQKKIFWERIKKSASYELLKDVVLNPNAYFSSSMVFLNQDSERSLHPIYGFVCDMIQSKKKLTKCFLAFLDYLTIFVERLFKLSH